MSPSHEPLPPFSGDETTCPKCGSANGTAPAEGENAAPATPHPGHNEWLVEMLLEKDTWGAWRVGTNLEKARECLRARQAEAPGRTFRLVRVTTVQTIEDGA